MQAHQASRLGQGSVILIRQLQRDTRQKATVRHLLPSGMGWMLDCRRVEIVLTDTSNIDSPAAVRTPTPNRKSGGGEPASSAKRTRLSSAFKERSKVHMILFVILFIKRNVSGPIESPFCAAKETSVAEFSGGVSQLADLHRRQLSALFLTAFD